MSEWAKEYRQHQAYRHNIQEFPDVLTQELVGILPTSSQQQARLTVPRSAKDASICETNQHNTSVLSNTNEATTSDAP